MTQTALFAPLLLMVFLTFFVGFLLLGLRIRSVKLGKIDHRYFYLNRESRGSKMPEHLIQAEQHYSNLFEVPVLFYLLVIALFVTHQVDGFQIVMAWLFVGTRIIHSWIHLTHNKLLWRMRTFVAGVIVLVLAWGEFAVNYLIR